MADEIMNNKKKVAFFVEGQTEAIFLTELLFAYFSYQSLRVTHRQAIGDDVVEIGVRGSPPQDTIYDILVLDCQGDNRVLSAIVDRQGYLHKQGYSEVIGLRDLFNPKSKGVTHADLKAEIDEYLAEQGCLISSKVFIAVMEIEAWFLCAPDFFGKINHALDSAAVTAAAGMDLSKTEIEAIAHPARIIEKVFATIGEAYNKSKGDTYRVTSKLNYEELVLEGPSRSSSLKEFVDHIHAAFS
ncbi:hypothetical protein QCE62_05690 [Caballeronia sp. LZ033]|uniref:hypothetical protein n=1 Tax=Caballeronia sp. LZ033 TaxID=3038566 RepID=UPI0028557D8D|nr:hypothetical protein [Caballeronia sp. LZ033]MDR5813082.1 hypothetical protein [Caballeronia sp. LZ033]